MLKWIGRCWSVCRAGIWIIKWNNSGSCDSCDCFHKRLMADCRSHLSNSLVRTWMPPRNQHTVNDSHFPSARRIVDYEAMKRLLDISSSIFCIESFSGFWCEVAFNVRVFSDNKSTLFVGGTVMVSNTILPLSDSHKHKSTELSCLLFQLFEGLPITSAQSTPSAY